MNKKIEENENEKCSHRNGIAEKVGTTLHIHTYLGSKRT